MSGRKLIRRGTGALVAVAAIAAVALVAPFPGKQTKRAASAPIEGEPSFNGGASVLVPFSGSLTTTGDAVAAAPSGGAYVAGSTGAGGGDIYVAHLGAAGVLDPAFGEAGLRTVDLGSTADRVGDVAAGPGGTVLVAGWRSGDNSNDVVVARLTGTGALDAAFGAGGLATINLGGDDRAHSLTVDGSGRPVILATAGAAVVVVRLTAAGALDPSFDSDGVSVAPLAAASNGAGALAVGADGGVYVAGSAPATVFDGPSRTVMAVGHLTSSGAVDTAFGVNGVSSAADSFDVRTGQASAVAVRADGALWLAGASNSSFGGATQPTLVQVSATGQTSAVFSQNAAFGETGDGVEAVFATDDGAIVAVRSTNGYTVYKRSGSGDPVFGFGGSGSAGVEVGVPRGVAMGPDGTILAVGTAVGAATIARLDVAGQPDAGFGTAGVATVTVSIPRQASAAAVAVVGGGKVLAAANLGGPAGGVGLVRLLPSGAVDPDFGIAGGMTVIPSFSTWIPYNGNLVNELMNLIGGYTLMAAGPELVRLEPRGDIDQSYGRFGRFVACNACRVTDVALGVDQKTVAAGLDGNGVVTLSRVTGDGFADETFNRNGFVELPWQVGGDAKVGVLSDRRVVVALPSLDGNTLTVARFAANGTIDSTFGGANGAQSTLAVTGPKQVLGLVARDDGTVLVVTRVGARIVLARFNDAGQLDTTFGPAGSATPGVVVHEIGGLVSAGSLAVNDAGKMYVAGTLERSGGRDGAIFRFGADGTNETADAVGGPGTFGIAGNDSGAAVTSGPAGELVGVGTTVVDSKGNLGLSVRRFKAGLNGPPVSPTPTVGPSLPSVSGRFHALSPARVLDTRSGVGATRGRVGAGSTVDVTMVGRGGVPASGVGSVALSVIAVGPTAPTFVTVYPAGEATPLASNLNAGAGAIVNNMVVAKLGVGGAVRLYNAVGSVDLVADVVGWFDDGSTNDGAQFNALSPSRILDTRDGLGAPARLVRAGTVVDLAVTGVGGVPGTAVSAVVLNVGVTQPSAASFITVFPTGETMPATSNVNVAAGATISRLVIAKVGAAGKVSLYNSDGNTHLIADVVGWFDAGVASPTTAFTGLTPTRVLDTRTGPGVATPGQLDGGKNLLADIAGYGGVPGNARSVVLNVTATDATAPTFLTVYPATDALPFAASVNVPAGSTVSNLVVAKLGTDGKVRIYSSAGKVNVIADVVGWFS